MDKDTGMRGGGKEAFKGEGLAVAAAERGYLNLMVTFLSLLNRMIRPEVPFFKPFAISMSS